MQIIDRRSENKLSKDEREKVFNSGRIFYQRKSDDTRHV